MRRLHYWVFLLVCGSLALPMSVLSFDDNTPLPKADQKLATRAEAILKRHCYDCHGDGGSDEGGFNFALNLPRLVATRKVVAGDVDASPLFQRIIKGEMPPEDAETRMSEKDVEWLKRWITSGAPVGTPKKERPYVSRESVLKQIAKDLKAAETRDRRFLRYLTITHLYNAGLSEGELDTVRLAMSKLLNSLSWERELIKPQPIDSEKTVFRFDLRSLRWSRETWEQLRNASPFAFESSNEWLTECSQLSDCPRPMIRGDWFVADASRPPLYHSLLDLPDTLDGLENQLRIKFQQNIEQDRAARAGFTQSGVSNNPRIIERHRISDGYCWISHDFASSVGNANFFRHPLQFQADGGEVIFS
ncbi:MAG: hypothetical protein KDA84_26055, partial [Planctomycetaceae bacterium]|nr:hypothetical protein [Planctomycetaceae bacterium]